MFTLLIVLFVLALTGLAMFALIGWRSRIVFTRPEALSDKQIAATIEITRRIMARTPQGSTTWSQAAAKHKAAVDEAQRRKGKRPFDNIELTTPAGQAQTRPNRQQRRASGRGKRSR